jgi:hypothetical protein
LSCVRKTFFLQFLVCIPFLENLTYTDTLINFKKRSWKQLFSDVKQGTWYKMLPEKMAEHGEVDFYRDVLGSPRLVVAPMVDASELAWRMLSKFFPLKGQ